MRRMILLTDKATGNTAIYTSLKPLWELYPTITPNEVHYSLSRLKKPFENETIKIERKEVLK
jgi:hypothetical protein